MLEVYIFPKIGWGAMGLKLFGSSKAPFLWISETVALFQTAGKCLCNQHAESSLARRVLKIGHFLEMMTLIPSRGHGELLDFIARIIFEKSWKSGGNSLCNVRNTGLLIFGIHAGFSKIRPGSFSHKLS